MVCNINVTANVTEDIDYLRAAAIPGPSAEERPVIAVLGWPISTVTLTDVCYLLYYTEEKYAFSFVLFC